MLLDGALRLLNPRSQPAFQFVDRFHGVRMRSVRSDRFLARSYETLAHLLESGGVILGQVSRAIAQRRFDRVGELRRILLEARGVALEFQRGGAGRYQNAVET